MRVELDMEELERDLAALDGLLEIRMEGTLFERFKGLTGMIVTAQAQVQLIRRRLAEGVYARPRPARVSAMLERIGEGEEAMKIDPSEYKPDVAIPPGVTIAEMIEDLGMSRAEMARRMGRPETLVDAWIEGWRAIDGEVAEGLERVLGLPADFWMNLEANYQATRKRLEDEAIVLSERDAERVRVVIGLPAPLPAEGLKRAVKRYEESGGVGSKRVEEDADNK